MAEEEFNPTEEGRRIAREYLSKRGWAREWRRTLARQLYPAVQREEFEEKQRRCDQMEEEAEEIFSREIERWRHDPSPQAKEVLRTIYEILGKRIDLGFFAKRVIDRLKREFHSF
ncbi:MAG: hypothetical protein ACPL4K_03810 [Candidatus Margulisiibacteriota bacterium]